MQIDYDSKIKDINSKMKELGIECKKTGEGRWIIGCFNVVEIKVGRSYNLFGHGQRRFTESKVYNYSAKRGHDELEEKHAYFADTLKEIKVSAINSKIKSLEGGKGGEK